MPLWLWRSSEKRTLTNPQGHLSMSLRIKAPKSLFSNHLLTKTNGVFQENNHSAIVPFVVIYISERVSVILDLQD